MKDDKKKLAKHIVDVMDMWLDWYVLHPMSMTDEEFNTLMSSYYRKLRKEMADIVDE